MGATEWLLLIALSVLWGGSFFFAEVALADLPPMTVVLGRVALAALALNAAVVLGGRRLPASPGVWGALLVMGALNNLVPFNLIVWGQTRIDGGLASILNATTPLFAVLLAHLLTRDERLTPRRVAGVLLGFAGVVVLIGPAALAGLDRQGLGQLAVLGGAASYACAGIYGRRLRGLPPIVAAAGMLTATALVMLPLALAVDRPWTLDAPPAGTVAAVLGLALLSTAVAYVLYFRILAAAGATNLLLVTFLIPVSALLLGAAFLGERPGWSSFAGMALISAGLAAIDGRLPARLPRRTAPDGGARAAPSRLPARIAPRFRRCWPPAPFRRGSRDRNRSPSMTSRRALAVLTAASAALAAACAPTPPPPSAGAAPAAAAPPAAGAAPGAGMPAGAVRVGEDLYMVPLAERVGGCPAYVAYSLTGMVPAVIYYRSAGGGFTMAREEAVCG